MEFPKDALAGGGDLLDRPGSVGYLWGQTTTHVHVYVPANGKRFVATAPRGQDPPILVKFSRKALSVQGSDGVTVEGKVAIGKETGRGFEATLGGSYNYVDSVIELSFALNEPWTPFKGNFGKWLSLAALDGAVTIGGDDAYLTAEATASMYWDMLEVIPKVLYFTGHPEPTLYNNGSLDAENKSYPTVAVQYSQYDESPTKYTLGAQFEGGIQVGSGGWALPLLQVTGTVSLDTENAEPDAIYATLEVFADFKTMVKETGRRQLVAAP